MKRETLKRWKSHLKHREGDDEANSWTSVTMMIPLRLWFEKKLKFRIPILELYWPLNSEVAPQNNGIQSEAPANLGKIKIMTTSDDDEHQHDHHDHHDDNDEENYEDDDDDESVGVGQ